MYKIVADDYGMSTEVNTAISELIRKNVVSKVSVMANDFFQYSHEDIKGAETGLHVNLLSYTKGLGINPGTKLSPLKLLCFVVSGRMDADKIMKNIKQQHAVLEQKGFKVSHMDTHQHVHIVPKILEALISYARTNRIGKIRCITMEPGHLFFYLSSLARFGFLAQMPKIILLYLAGILMKIKLNRVNIGYCKNLIVMPLVDGGDYEGFLKEMINRFKNSDAELVTHPAFEMKTDRLDDYTKGRYVEYCSLLRQGKVLHGQ